MATKHTFRARLVWQKGASTGGSAGTHRVELEGKQPLEISAAPQFHGDPSRANPEELFLASLASCQMLTYLALAARAGIDVLAYEDPAEATL
ncbi:MAG: OsmC family protein, partial [Candidatus Binatia bacterium]